MTSFMDDIEQSIRDAAQHKIVEQVQQLAADMPNVRAVLKEIDEGNLAELKLEERLVPISLPETLWRQFDTIANIMETTETIKPIEESKDTFAQFRKHFPNASLNQMVVVHAIIDYICRTTDRADQTAQISEAIKRISKEMPDLIKKLKSDPEE